MLPFIAEFLRTSLGIEKTGGELVIGNKLHGAELGEGSSGVRGVNGANYAFDNPYFKDDDGKTPPLPLPPGN